jgi:hypothetical protein
MNWVFTLYLALLFFLLTPGVLLSLPSGGKKLTVAFVHTIVFVIVWQLTHKYVWLMTSPHLIMPNISS